MQDKRSLLGQLIVWARQPRVLGSVVLILGALVTAISVITVSHSNRRMYGELQKLRDAQNELDGEYERLLLEQSAWTEYSRVEELSVDKLAMRPVSPGTTVIIREMGRID